MLKSDVFCFYNLPKIQKGDPSLCVILVIFMKLAEVRLEPLNNLVFDSYLFTSSLSKLKTKRYR